MAGSEDREGRRSRKPPRKLGRCTAVIREKVRKFLLWLADLFEPPRGPRAKMLQQFLRYVEKRIGGMSLPHFRWLLLAAVVLVGCVLYLLTKDKTWTSPNVAIWFSESADADTSANYLTDAYEPALRMIKDAMGDMKVFLCCDSKPQSLKGNWNVVNARLGCYRTDAAGQYEVRIEMRGVPRPILEPYESDDPLIPRFSAIRVCRRIRNHIFEGCPLRGMCRLRPDKFVTLDIGSLAGVLEQDEFRILKLSKFGTRLKMGLGTVKVELGGVKERESRASIKDGVMEDDKVYPVERILPNQ